MNDTLIDFIHASHGSLDSPYELGAGFAPGAGLYAHPAGQPIQRCLFVRQAMGLLSQIKLQAVLDLPQEFVGSG